LNLVPDDRLDRHALILDLHGRGLTDKEIAEELNGRGVSTPTGLAYYPQLVFVTRRKIGLRKYRQENVVQEIGTPAIFLGRFAGSTPTTSPPSKPTNSPSSVSKKKRLSRMT
jgi:hypothetical protein